MANETTNEMTGDMMDEQVQQNGEQSQTTEGESAEVLVVASKIKNYIRSHSGMNTSANVMEALSNRIRKMCDQAIDHARQDGRKTVMDRDFPV